MAVFFLYTYSNKFAIYPKTYNIVQIRSEYAAFSRNPYMYMVKYV